ncbi:hypothetical protein CDV31_014568 [Fusarium ambrosium]|uniref:BZIP domain-containing protein n=1 Tax=Fusarium ambrosium TaxID=131363 RepID=A0A428SVH9_9HYPO|nr:hypothetical protein CDV31_014568 [Fusarium ambrosium]
MSDRNGTSEKTSLSYTGFQLPIYTPEGSPTMTTTESATLSPETSPSPFATLSDYETHGPHNVLHNALDAVGNPVEESIQSYPGWVTLREPSKCMCDTVRNYLEDCEQLGYGAPSLVLIPPGRLHDPIPVTVNVDQTSEEANGKRRRNAMASTRHRQKKKTDWQHDGRIAEMGGRTLLRERHRQRNRMDRRPPPPEAHGVFVVICGRPTCTLEHPPMDYCPLELRENFYETSAAAKSWAKGDVEYDGSSRVQAVRAATGFGEAHRLVDHSYVPVEGSWPSHGCNDQYQSPYQHWPSTG